MHDDHEQQVQTTQDHVQLDTSRSDAVQMTQGHVQLDTSRSDAVQMTQGHVQLDTSRSDAVQMTQGHVQLDTSRSDAVQMTQGHVQLDTSRSDAVQMTQGHVQLDTSRSDAEAVSGTSGTHAETVSVSAVGSINDSSVSRCDYQVQLCGSAASKDVTLCTAAVSSHSASHSECVGILYDASHSECVGILYDASHPSCSAVTADTGCVSSVSSKSLQVDVLLPLFGFTHTFWYPSCC